MPAFSTEPAATDDFQLTTADIARLLESPTIDTRIEVLSKVTQQYAKPSLTETQRDIAEQIFRHLVNDSAIRIRRAMAENLAGNPILPRDVALLLAKDVESVATPVLQISEVLSDSDLIEIVENSEEIWRYLAIARRPLISEPVSAVLIDTDHSEVVSQLLENRGSQIAEYDFGRLVTRAVNDGDIAKRLVGRDLLPPAIAEKLMHVVSDELATQLKGKMPPLGEQITVGLRHATEYSTIELLSGPTDRESMLELAAQLLQEGRLTSSLIINALCHGNIEFFEVALSQLASIPIENAHLLIHDKGKLGFRALYNKSGLPATMYHPVRLLLDSVKGVIEQGVRPGNAHFSNRVVGMMLEASEREPIENLSYLLALIRQPQH